MKSIKEKAEEYSSGYMNLDRQQVAKQALECGANYVLGEIEKMFSKANKYKDGSDHTILYLDIEFLIEQLKK